MEYLPGDLVSKHLPIHLMVLLSKACKKAFEPYLKRPWTFDGVLVDTLKCVNGIYGFRFELTRERGLTADWLLSWGFAEVIYKAWVSHSIISTSDLCHEYSFKAFAECLMLSTVMETVGTVNSVLKCLLEQNRACMTKSMYWCLYKAKGEEPGVIERVRDVALTYQERDEPVVIFDNITLALGPLMKEVSPRDMIKLSHSLRRLEGNTEHISQYRFENGVLYEHNPQYYSNPKYRCSKSICIRFKTEFDAYRLGPCYNKYERGTTILDEKVINGIKFGLIHGNSVHPDGVKIMVIN